MRFLFDENMPLRLMRHLKKQGHGASRTPAGLKNGKVLALAREERRILLTRDSDFLDLRRYPPHKYSGIVCFQIHPPLLEALTKALERLLKDIPEAQFHGSTFALTERGFEKFPPQ